MKNKVYCKNCKHRYKFYYKYRISYQKFVQTVCLKGLTLLDVYDNNTAYKINSCTKQNPNFECPLYEKKWWLFWVK